MINVLLLYYTPEYDIIPFTSILPKYSEVLVLRMKTFRHLQQEKFRLRMYYKYEVLRAKYKRQ